MSLTLSNWLNKPKRLSSYTPAQQRRGLDKVLDDIEPATHGVDFGAWVEHALTPPCRLSSAELQARTDKACGDDDEQERRCTTDA